MLRFAKILTSLFVIVQFFGQGPAYAISKLDLKSFSLERALSANYKEFPSLGDFDFKKEYFKLRFLTPVSGYRYAINNKDKVMFKKHSRRKKDPYSLSEDNLSELKTWDYSKPLVSLVMVPQPQTKNIVKLGRFLGYTVAGAFTIGTFGIGMATLGLPGKIKGYKVSKDFYKAYIEDPEGMVCDAKTSETHVMDSISQKYFFPDDQYEKFVDKLLMGVFAFDPNCFLSDEKLKLKVRDEKDNQVLSFSISKKLKKVIEKDFLLGLKL